MAHVDETKFIIEGEEWVAAQRGDTPTHCMVPIVYAADLVELLRGIAFFYNSSPNMGTNVVNCHGPGGSWTLTTDNMSEIADYLERMTP